MKLKLLIVLTTAFAVSGCATNGLVYNTSVEPESRSNGYLCDIKETVKLTRAEKEYTLVNLISETVDEKSQCRAENFQNKAYMRYLFVDYSDSQYRYGNQFAYRRDNGSFGALDHWIDLKTIYKDLDSEELVALAESLPYEFGQLLEMRDTGTAFWFKSRNSKTNSSRTWLQNDGDNFKRTDFDNNGAKTVQCSSDGQLWSDC